MSTQPAAPKLPNRKSNSPARLIIEKASEIAVAPPLRLRDDPEAKRVITVDFSACRTIALDLLLPPMLEAGKAWEMVVEQIRRLDSEAYGYFKRTVSFGCDMTALVVEYPRHHGNLFPKYKQLISKAIKATGLDIPKIHCMPYTDVDAEASGAVQEIEGNTKENNGSGEEQESALTLLKMSEIIAEEP